MAACKGHKRISWPLAVGKLEENAWPARYMEQGMMRTPHASVAYLPSDGLRSGLVFHPALTRAMPRKATLNPSRLGCMIALR